MLPLGPKLATITKKNESQLKLMAIVTKTLLFF